MQTGVKQSIVTRVRVAFLFVCLFSGAVIWKVARIQFRDGDKWREQSRKRTVSYRPVFATRGNIYSDNESILATSLPSYLVCWDPSVVDSAALRDNVDSLSWHLAQLFGGPAETYRRKLVNAHASGKVKYVRLAKRRIGYQEKKHIARWPLFRLGQNKGGIIFEKEDQRFNPFNPLALRTIGYVSKGNSGAGLEYTFDKQLAGRNGQALFERIPGGWRPRPDGDVIKPVPGLDIVTTLDINLQDVAETALRRALLKNRAAYGTVVLMEVQTGEIKAIANLGRKRVPGQEEDDYVEDYNYAMANQGLTEPGSTFKLASLMALFEENPALKLTDTVNTGNGRMLVGGAVKTDTHGHGRISIQQVFEMSSNIGVAKLIVEEFRNKEKNYTDRVRSFGLGEPLGLQMAGEAHPVVKSTENRSWSRTSLSTMSIGYEVKLAPIHTLAFYNAVANGGRKVRPYLVKEIRQADQVTKHFEPVTLKERICSPATAAKLRQIMEGVVASRHGTGKAVRSPDYKVAGKTGTAWKLENGHYVKKYITSFVGYFPADKPKYSCIVLIDSPSEGRIYGGDVAAPVFRELADKAFALDPARQAEMQGHTPDTTRRPLLPYVRAGQHDELALVCQRLGVRATASAAPAPDEWVKARPETTRTTAPMARAVTWRENAVRPGRVPDVVGLTLRDALFLLGNQGITVTTEGQGHVVAQSLAVGTRAPVGTPLHLVLRGPLPLESLYVAPAPTLIAAGKGVKLTAPARGRREARAAEPAGERPAALVVGEKPIAEKKPVEKKPAEKKNLKKPAPKKPAPKKTTDNKKKPAKSTAEKPTEKKPAKPTPKKPSTSQPNQ